MARARLTILALGTCLGAALAMPARAQAPPGVVTDGVPPLPPEIEQATRRYGTAVSNVFMDWDPDSQSMLIDSMGTKTWQLHLLLGPDGEKRMTTDFSDKVAAGGFLPKTGNMVVFMADHHGDEFYQLYGLDPTTGVTRLLTDGETLNTDPLFSHSGLQIAYRSTLQDHVHSDIYVMNPHRREDGRMIFRINGGLGAWGAWILCDWAHDEHHILASHVVARGMGYLWSIDTITGETKLLTQQRDTQRPYGEARFTPNDDGIYTITLRGKEARTIDWLPLTPDARVPKLPTVRTADDIELSPDGTLLAYITDDRHSSHLHFFNTVTGEGLPAPSLAEGYFNNVKWNSTGTEVGFTYGAADQPDQAFSYAPQTGQLIQWTKPGVDLPPSSGIKPELVQIQSFDDLMISGYLYRPDPQKFPGKRPVIIDIHGGPTAEFLPTYLGLSNYYLNEAGVALLYPNVRGSTGFGPEFQELDRGYKREDAVKDIGAFLDWIDKDPGLDANRIGVRGGSYGGYMTLATLFHYSNRVRCGSDLMGISDFVTLIRNTRPYWLTSARYEFGDERYPEMNKFLQSISPLNHVQEIGDPVMITAGKNDPRVPASESEQMVKALRAGNKIVWYMLGENEGHGFSQSPDELYRAAAEAYFFQTYLLPEQRVTPLLPEDKPISAPVLDQGPD